MLTIETAVLLAAFLALQSAFIAARFRVFRIEGPTPLGVRVIETSTLACLGLDGGLIMRRGGGSAPCDLLAALAALASASLFSWGLRTVRRGQLTAAFSSDAPTELLTRGPYRWVRNPFYLAYLLCYVQAALASRSAWALVPLAWMALVYRAAARHEEGKFLASALADDYRSYCEATGTFFPRLVKRGAVRS